VAEAAPPRAAPAPAQAQAQALQLRLVCEQVRRSPYAVLAADALVAWLLTRADLAHGGALAWLLASSLVSFGRAFYANRVVARVGNDAGLALRRLLGWFFAVGLTRSWPIVIAFQGSAPDMHYLVTMIMMGLAAGGVSTAVGVVSIYAAWAAPVALTLAGAWLSLHSFESTWIAVLLLMMFLLLILYVRDYGRTLARQVELAEKLRAERDRADAERERAEAERQRAEHAVIARTRFFAAASHDLRQPLGVLRWYGDAVTAHARRLDHEALLAIGEGIGRALERAEPLVRKYLDIAQIDARALEISLRPCNVATILEKVRDAYAREAEERSLTLRTDFRCAVALLVANTDESVLRNILDNLAGNALKFTVVGGVTLGAHWLAGDTGPRVRVWVSDTGVGIPESEHQRVFEDFYQVGNAERSQSKGVGLGLAIARRQAELLGIELRLASRVGHGSTFEFDLLASTEAPPTPAEHASPAAATPQTLRVLVIDDEPEVRLSLRMMLEAVGWQVRTASGLPGALLELEQGFKPDALVVDYRLQGEYTGGEVVAELHAAGCVVPAVVVTGDTAPERLTELKRTGLPVLHKPVQGERLIATLVEAVTTREN